MCVCIYVCVHYLTMKYDCEVNTVIPLLKDTLYK